MIPRKEHMNHQSQLSDLFAQLKLQCSVVHGLRAPLQGDSVSNSIYRGSGAEVRLLFQPDMAREGGQGGG